MKRRESIWWLVALVALLLLIVALDHYQPQITYFINEIGREP